MKQINFYYWSYLLPLLSGRFESLGETITVSTIQGCDIGRCPSHGAVNCQPPRIPEGEVNS